MNDKAIIAVIGYTEFNIESVESDVEFIKIDSVQDAKGITYNGYLVGSSGHEDIIKEVKMRTRSNSEPPTARYVL